MIDDRADTTWDRALDDLFLRIGHRFARADLRRRMRDYVHALLGPVGRKNGWQLAEYAGHRTPDGLQRLLNGATWDADDVRDDLQAYVAEKLGEDGGVLILDDTGFVKKGTTSAGVHRQYSGTAGRTEIPQRGCPQPDRRLRRLRHHPRQVPGGPRTVFPGGADPQPKSWTDDRQRCRAAKIPDERAFATKGELAKTMVVRALASPLPIAWVTADSAYGQEWRFRRLLEEIAVGYVLAVPKSQQVPRFGRIDHLFTQAPQEAWERRSCGDGAKGPRVYHWAAVQLPAIEDLDGDQPTHQRWALARRSISRPDEIAYYLGY
ncbi:transposase [Streptomyces sp. NWU49]|uniref:transposase n=1 Tax=Streptomyces sp. NWU49 TaxID=2201153 RepID=UPI00215B697F|nr:transposase [Streptomyces sp. NWU49]